jgi:hypothetical protein
VPDHLPRFLLREPTDTYALTLYFAPLKCAGQTDADWFQCTKLRCRRQTFDYLHPRAQPYGQLSQFDHNLTFNVQVVFSKGKRVSKSASPSKHVSISFGWFVSQLRYQYMRRINNTDAKCSGRRGIQYRLLPSPPSDACGACT